MGSGSCRRCGSIPPAPSGSRDAQKLFENDGLVREMGLARNMKRKPSMQGARLDTLTSWDPRDVELALFGKINFMRLKPQRFIRTVNRKVKEELRGVCPESHRELIAFLQDQDSLPALRISFVLSQVAKMQCDQACCVETMDFSNYLAETKKIGVERRLDAYGVQCGRCDELYAFAATSSVTTMLLYLLTMGPKDVLRRRREALFSESFDFIGIACTEHPVTKHMCCLAFAERKKRVASEKALA